jgi:lysophospholipase L1-like esterase
MRGVLRFAVINAGVLIGLLLTVLFLASLAGDVHNVAKALIGKDDKRAELPNYADHDYARRIYRDQRASTKQYAPFIEWRRSALKSETLNIDERGYRIHTLGKDNNRPEATTLGFFGASTVWGTGVDDNGTIPAKFDTITDEYEVTNYGERGFTSMQNLIELMTLINQGDEPRSVVFYVGFPDIFVACNRAVTRRLNGHSEELRIQSALDRTSNTNYLYNNLVSPVLAIVYRFVRVGEDVMEPACSTDSAYAERVAEMMVRNLEMAQDIVKGYNGRFYAVLAPTAFAGKPRTDHVDQNNAFNNALGREVVAVYPRFLAKMAARGYPWFADATDVLDGDQYYLLDGAHLSEQGNAAVAARIKRLIDSHPMSYTKIDEPNP